MKDGVLSAFEPMVSRVHPSSFRLHNLTEGYSVNG